MRWRGGNAQNSSLGQTCAMALPPSASASASAKNRGQTAFFLVANRTTEGSPYYSKVSPAASWWRDQSS